MGLQTFGGTELFIFSLPVERTCAEVGVQLTVKVGQIRVQLRDTSLEDV